MMEKKQKRKVVTKVWILVLSCILMLGCLKPVNAAIKNDTPVDFVLVLDCSGSLSTSDEQRLSVSAAKMFVDMLPAENARLAVVALGNDYGANAYVLDANSGENYQVEQAFELQNITEQEQKQQAKNIIDDVTSQVNTNAYTQIGYALQAACKILEDGGTVSDSASIILLSDGRVSGQNDGYNGDYDYTSIDQAKAKAKEMGWPIYCLELNYDQLNNETGKNAEGKEDYHGKIAFYQMPKIAGETGGARIELNSPTEAQNAFSEIFAKFFDAVPTTASGIIQNGQVELDFDIDEMIAETNITLTGNTSEVNEIVLRNSDGKEFSYQKDTKDENKIITFGDKYITAKLLTPKEGKWSVIAKGTDGVEIGMYAVSIREMNLQLNAQTDLLEDGSNEATIPKGSKIDFTATYIYNGSPYSSETFYKGSKAFLYVEESGQKVEMTGGEDNYQGSLQFDGSGTYTVKAVVESEKFRNEKKESGAYVFHVGNIPTEAKGTIPDQETSVGGKIGPIDCSQYFTNDDGDKITYTASFDKTADMKVDFTEDGVMTVDAGQTAGDYEVNITANDGSMDPENPVVQTFRIKINNQPLQLKSGDTARIYISYNADSMPGFLRNLTGVDKEGEKSISWTKYFEDPDDIVPVITLEPQNGSDAISVDYADGEFHVKALSAGKAVYKVTAEDRSDASVVCNMNLEVESVNAKTVVWQQLKLYVIILAILLIVVIVLLFVVFGNRKIYGIWDISGNNGKHADRKKLGASKHGKKSKCKLDNILNDLDIPSGFGNVMLVAGNNINKKVFITGLDKADEIIYNGQVISDKKRAKKLAIGKRQRITIKKNGIIVTLERH